MSSGSADLRTLKSLLHSITDIGGNLGTAEIGRQEQNRDKIIATWSSTTRTSFFFLPVLPVLTFNFNFSNYRFGS